MVLVGDVKFYTHLLFFLQRIEMRYNTIIKTGYVWKVVYM